MSTSLFCSACGTEVPGRPPKASFAVCPNVACLAILHVERPATDVFAMRVSDLAAPTNVLQAARSLRAQIAADMRARGMS